MARRWMTICIGLGFVLAMTGCNRNQELQTELFRTRDRTKSQMDILKKSNELLNRQLNDLRAKITDLEDSNTRLSNELADYATRPEEVKLEIITEVNTTFASIAKKQDEFMADVNQRFDSRTAQIDSTLGTRVDSLKATLDKHSEFVHFVASEQDSINRVFANRFDSRPWYESILGKWQDMQRAEATP